MFIEKPIVKFKFVSNKNSNPGTHITLYYYYKPDWLSHQNQRKLSRQKQIVS